MRNFNGKIKNKVKSFEVEFPSFYARIGSPLGAEVHPSMTNDQLL